tara:strand:+ start:254 stop:646 length:393 start_codon:yes stop_codon:yes gene_type:complete
MPTSAHSKNYVWWTERNKIAIATTSDGVNFTSPTTDGEIVRIFAIARPGLFTEGASMSMAEDTPLSKIPSQFQDAIAAKVTSLLYEDNPDTLQSAQYWEAKYLNYVKDAKEYGNKERLNATSYQIRPYDF